MANILTFVIVFCWMIYVPNRPNLAMQKVLKCTLSNFDILRSWIVPLKHLALTSGLYMYQMEWLSLLCRDSFVLKQLCTRCCLSLQKFFVHPYDLTDMKYLFTKWQWISSHSLDYIFDPIPDVTNISCD